MKKNIPNKYKPFPFWSWNDELEEEELIKQIDWMHENGIGGFFMHARGGLTTPYLGEKWFKCVEACLKRAKELDMEAYAYDENGWPSGFAGGELLKDYEDKEVYLGIRPEAVFLKGDKNNEKPSNDIKEVCDFAELLGYERIVYTYLNGQKFILKTSIKSEVESGDEVAFNFNMNNLYFFDVETENRIA